MAENYPTSIRGTVRNGVIVPDEPIPWPDGTKVLIHILSEPPKPAR